MIWKIVNLIFKICNKIYFSEQKKSWELALAASNSYQDNSIFRKVIQCYEGIDNKEREFYERDGLLLEKKPDETDFISFLQHNIPINNKTFQILDYGGSLGSRYFSNYNFINNNNIEWNILEQTAFVEYGKKNLQKKNLFFFDNLEDCFKDKKIDCVIFSGSLQYLENYLKILNEIKFQKINLLYLDYLPFSNYNENKIFVQNIPKKIVYSSYPIHIFSKKIFIKYLKKNNFKIVQLKNKPTVFYGFNYHSLILKT